MTNGAYLGDKGKKWKRKQGVLKICRVLEGNKKKR